MNSPGKHPGDSDSEPDYAPPWARDQIRPIFAHSASLPVEKRTPNELIGGGRAFGDDPAWLRRGLEPDVVPEPPGGFADFWPIVMRLGVVCGVAAIVAGAVVLLFSGKSPVQESVRAKTPPPSIASASSALPSAQSPGIVPAVLDDKSANAANSAPPPQTPPAQPQPQAAPPAEAPAAAPPSPQVIATAPANQAPASVEPSPAPPVNPPAPAAKPPAIPPASETSPPAQAAPNPPPQPAAPAPVPRPAVTLDNDEIVRLIARGKDLLNDGDFAAARLLFERAANAGSADAALALGSTYDPLVIKRLGAVAVTPDLAKARKWYQFAADHGSAAASLQLANLAHAH
jgi:hypothetical protein